jgi:hypothetical protein
LDEDRGARGTVGARIQIVAISANSLFGREPDVSLLRAFVADATQQAGRSADPQRGVGKSARLNLLARMLRAAEAEAERRSRRR